MLHDTSKPWTDLFGRVETRTGVPRLKLLIGFLLATSVILLVFGTNAMALSNAIGLIYPAKATMISPPEVAELRSSRRRCRGPKQKVHVLAYVLRGLDRKAVLRIRLIAISVVLIVENIFF